MHPKAGSAQGSLLANMLSLRYKMAWVRSLSTHAVHPESHELQVWDPEALADTSSAGLFHRHKITPYADMQLQGKVHASFVQGHMVFSAAKQLSRTGCGQPILRHQLH